MAEKPSVSELQQFCKDEWAKTPPLSQTFDWSSCCQGWPNQLSALGAINFHTGTFFPPH